VGVTPHSRPAGLTVAVRCAWTAVAARSEREIRAVFLVPDRERSIDLERLLQLRGWDARSAELLPEDRGDRFHLEVVARKYFNTEMDSSELEMLRSSLEDCAELCGGVMDGWELEV
jgi:hypothetical protein